MAANPNIEVILFTSPTCGPCKQLKPNMVKLQAQHQFKLRVIEYSEQTKGEFDANAIRVAPTCIGVNEHGERLGIFVGAQALPILENHLRKWGVIV